jgi:PII-like signaling protein
VWHWLGLWGWLPEQPGKGTMMNSGELLRFYVKANKRQGGKPLYRSIVERAREMGMAGASVFSTELSLGEHRAIHDARSEYSSYELPVVIEIVDDPARIAALIAELGPLAELTMATLEPVEVVHYSSHARGKGAGDVLS